MIEFKLVGYVDGKEMSSVSVASRAAQRASEAVKHTANHNELVNDIIKAIIGQLGPTEGEQRLDVMVRVVLFKASLGAARGKA